jgi:hypothetical protein
MEELLSMELYRRSGRRVTRRPQPGPDRSVASLDAVILDHLAGKHAARCQTTGGHPHQRLTRREKAEALRPAAEAAGVDA